MSNFFSNISNNSNNNFNFFSDFSSKNTVNNTANTNEETKITEQYDNLKDSYKEIFLKAALSIRKRLKEFEPQNVCEKCKVKDCCIKDKEKDPFFPYPESCEYKGWQFQIITFLTTEYKQELQKAFKKLLEKKCAYSCSKCGSCCQLATSEFSYEQLKQQAMRGNKFASEFTSVFVPYKSEEEARSANPDYFELLDKLEIEDNIYYYYCPKLKNNLCSDYENRPDVCKNFPNNPLKLLPSKCAFNAWRNEINEEALTLNAKMDLINFYKKDLS